MRRNMMLLSGFLGVHVIVLIDEAAAAKNLEVWWSAAKGACRIGDFKRHTHWQEREGWKEVNRGGGEERFCMCSSSGHVYTEESTMVFSKDHHSSVRHDGHPQWLRVNTFMNSSSLFLSVSLILSLSLSLDYNSDVSDDSSWSAQGCMYVCVLFKGRVPQPSSVLAPVQSRLSS